MHCGIIAIAPQDLDSQYVVTLFSLRFSLGNFYWLIFKFTHSYVTTNVLMNIGSSQQTISRKISELNDIVDQPSTEHSIQKPQSTSMKFIKPLGHIQKLIFHHWNISWKIWQKKNGWISR